MFRNIQTLRQRKEEFELTIFENIITTNDYERVLTANDLSAEELLMKDYLNKKADYIENNKFTLLHSAIKKDKPQIIEFIKFITGDINYTDLNLNSPLHIAAQIGTAEIIQTLLENGAKDSVNSERKTPFMIAEQRYQTNQNHDNLTLKALLCADFLSLQGLQNCDTLHESGLDYLDEFESFAEYVEQTKTLTSTSQDYLQYVQDLLSEQRTNLASPSPKPNKIKHISSSNNQEEANAVTMNR